MAGFFSRGRRQDYQGFSKYQAEVHESGTVAGLPRTSSLGNGAGLAAAAALRMHQKQQPQHQQQQPQQSQQSYTHQLQHQQQQQRVKRSNSLSSANRTNSLRQYVYHPTGSYVPGGGIARAPVSGSSRTSSLTAASRPPVAHAHARVPAPAPAPKSYGQYHQVAENGNGNVNYDEVEEVVTTKTTKVVDSQGRVVSIKTTTIRTLPDGSNVIETTTKNISRSNSRANSLNSSNIRTGSLLSTDNAVNLTKIDEDLHDFEYNYELDNNRLGNRNNLKLNIPEEPIAEAEEHENAALLKTVKSGETSPIKPLRSILKNSQPPKFDSEDNPEFRDEAEPVESSSSHPYKAISGDALQPPKFKVPTSPPLSSKQANQKSPRARNGDVVSSSSSIKFDDRVETIPIYSKALGKPFTPTTTKPKVNTVDGLTVDADFYAAAMQAAYKKVYGENAHAPESQLPVSPPQQRTVEDSPPQYHPTSPAKSQRTYSLTSHLRSRQPERVSEDVDEFQYENHHKDFVKHSLREPLPKSSTRKERSKEEKRYLKQLQAEKELAEKQARKEAKQQQKQAKKEKKASPEGSSFLNLFGRRKSSISSSPVDLSYIPAADPIDTNYAPVEHSAVPETVESRIAEAPVEHPVEHVVPHVEAPREVPSEAFREAPREAPVEAVPERVIPVSRNVQADYDRPNVREYLNEPVPERTPESKPPLNTTDSITYHEPSRIAPALNVNPLSNDTSESTSVAFPRETILATVPVPEPTHNNVHLPDPDLREQPAVTHDTFELPKETAREPQETFIQPQEIHHETVGQPQETLQEAQVIAPPQDYFRVPQDKLEDAPEVIPSKELDHVNTTASSPYLSASSYRGASSPNEIETVEEELDDVHKTIPVPTLKSVEPVAEYDSDDDYEEGGEETGFDKSALKRAILGSPKSPGNNYQEPLQQTVGSSTEFNKGLQQEYAVVAAYIEGDKQGTTETKVEKTIPTESFTETAPKVEIPFIPRQEVAPIPREEFVAPREETRAFPRDETVNTFSTAPPIEDSITVVEPPHEFVPGSENAQRVNHQRESSIPHAPISPVRANVTKPLPADTSVPETPVDTNARTSPEPLDTSVIAKPNTAVLGGRNPESPGDDKSTVPTIASQKSDQPTNSTVATEHQTQAVLETNPESEVPVAEKQTKKKKAKKPSRFKEKMFKYFVTSYDNNNINNK